MSDIRRKVPPNLLKTGAIAKAAKPSRFEAVRLLELGRLVEPALDIELPELDGAGDAGIVPDNIRAVAAVYFAAALEDMKLFAVADKVAEHFTSGALPLSRGGAAEPLHRYVQHAHERLRADERVALYARTVNHDGFRRLWIDFLAGVSRGAGESAQTAGRALAEYASACGGGGLHLVALELQALVHEILAILDHSDLLAAYGVRDRWQLVDRVSALHLGGSPNQVEGRTKAQAGSQILLWMAAHAAALRPGESPPFAQIAAAVERWLAVTGAPSASQDPSAMP